MDFGTCPTGWHIEGDLSNQVAVSTGSTVFNMFITCCGIYAAMIWYSGHAEKRTGNWCFTDGVISFEDVYSVYEELFSGRVLMIVSDCCYAGKWVLEARKTQESTEEDTKPEEDITHEEDITPEEDSGPKNTKTLFKIYASCQANEIAFEQTFLEELVQIEKKHSVLMFLDYPVKIDWCSRTQTPSYHYSTAY